MVWLKEVKSLAYLNSFSITHNCTVYDLVRQQGLIENIKNYNCRKAIKWKYKPNKALIIYFVLNCKIMERLANKTVEELKQIREDYVKKYIGDFNKPFGYKSELKNLDRLIAAKG